MSFFEKHRLLVLLNSSSFLAFVSLALIRSLPFSPFDVLWIRETALFEHAALTRVMIAISTVLSPYVISAFSLALIGIFILKKRFVWAVFFACSVILTLLSALFLKDVFQVARPGTALIKEVGWSFPSAHAAAASVFFFSVLYWIEENVHDGAIIALWAITSIFLVVAVGLSRTYLEVHWMTDVLAGFALGAFWVSATLLMLEYKLKRDSLKSAS